MTKRPHSASHALTDKQKKWTFSPSSFVLLAGLMLILGYAAGTRNDQILSAIAPAIGLKVETATLDMSSVQNTFRQLKANYDGTVDDQKLIEGASKGLVAAAGDEHTVYFDREEAKEFNNDLSGTIGGGIGAEIGLRNERPTVIRALKDTPADRAGLLTGDTILAVNDMDVADKTVDETVKLIRGEIGTTVKLSVLRDQDRKEVTITREEISSPSVDSKIEGDVGILTISRFDEQTGMLARQVAQEFADRDVKKVILDLRGNGGGYLSAAPQVAGLWLRDKVVVSERKGGRVEGEQKSGNNALLEGLPTVVLMNGGTASASEIVIGALKDYGVASLVGEKSYGKGTVQSVVELNGGSILKVTVQRWFTPKGTNIDGNGFAPDQAIELSRDDVNAGRDTQIDAAKERLNK